MINKTQLTDALKASGVYDFDPKENDWDDDMFYITPLDRNLKKYEFDVYNKWKCFASHSIKETSFLYNLPKLKVETDIKNGKVRIEQDDFYMVYDEDTLNSYITECKEVYKDYKFKLKQVLIQKRLDSMSEDFTF